MENKYYFLTFHAKCKVFVENRQFAQNMVDFNRKFVFFEKLMI